MDTNVKNSPMTDMVDAMKSMMELTTPKPKWVASEVTEGTHEGTLDTGTDFDSAEIVASETNIGYRTLSNGAGSSFKAACVKIGTTWYGLTAGSSKAELGKKYKVTSFQLERPGKTTIIQAILTPLA